MATVKKAAKKSPAKAAKAAAKPAPVKSSTKFVTVGDAKIEVERRGKGRPLLLLYGEEALELEAAFVDELARKYEVIIPSPPGFGKSNRPAWITNMDDIAYLYLDLLEKLDLKKVTVMGCSLGGWIALEMATKDCSRFAKLLLVDPYGVKIGGPWDRDIADIWATHPATLAKLKWHNPEVGKRDFPSMPEAKLEIIARNIETTARFCWEPYFHNPKLKHRLNRVSVPTLFVWGKSDGIVKESYGKAYAKLVKGAKFASIAKAGHFPHLEQPEAFLKAVKGFI